MKKNVLKLAQKGGMMIEALAMLGLIAVVTPTMYKKSAERTLEVEDINTATSMRSVMSAADSYVSSHYGELVQEMTADNATTKSLNLETDLQPYLPYGFNPNRLYDFEAPQVSVARNGNNLTAFVLFPAKEDGENGLGQERTVRIATLIGANGGYVNGDHTAKGIGGIWNLDNDDDSNVRFSNLFSGQNPNIYSIVTASSDAINNTNTEEDTDKFLYRTDGNGKWHNTMRADLYMGGDIENDNNDGYKRNSDFFSIRRVKSLIIGADEDVDNYGLYISDDADNPNAYISGTLEAAKHDDGVPNFKVEKNNIFGAYTSEDSGKYAFTLANNHLRYGYNLEDDRYVYENAYNFTVDKYGAIRSRGSTKLSNSKDGKWTSVEIGLLQSSDSGSAVRGHLFEGTYNSGSSNAEKGAGKVSLVNENTFVAKGKKRDGSGNYNIDYADRIVLANDGTKGDSTSWNKTVSYNTSPVFPVRIGSNAKVDGILATAQLDTQNVRAATLEVGSNNIDDPEKWLKVDAEGIHGSHVDNDNNNAVFEVHKNFASIGVGDEDVTKGLTFSESDTGKRSFLFVGKDRGIDLASTQKIDIYTRGSNGSAPEININTDVVQEKLVGKDVIFSSKEAANTESTNVKIQKTNFEVQDAGNNLVFEVKGNTNSPITENRSNKYDVAVHGRAVFTSGVNNPSTGRQSPDRVYMNISDNLNSDALVNIVQDNQSSTEDEGIFKEILTIDGDGEPWSTSSTGTNGTVYIRKGMLEITPITKTAFEDQSKYYDDQDLSADTGYGVIKASRLVANNPNIKNDAKAPSAVPQFFTGNDYTDYNGSSDDTGRYDTYMVNPAYTSVMHDIKLTTRGGARLSDILPDFINKGIYITSNTYKDNITSLKFALDGGVVKPEGGATPLSGPITLGDEDSWASPYLGFIPAPQCPPGYNRVITMSPQSFMMSQAGQMQRGDHASKQYKDKDNHWRDGVYYTKNQVPNRTAFTAYEQAGINDNPYIQQGFQQVSFEDDVDLVDTNGNVKQVVTAQNGAPQTVKAKTSALNLRAIDSDGNVVSSGNPYFLLSYGDTTPPLTIQQSTWLKTNVVPVDNTGNSYSIGDTNSGYTIGWAAIMGFVYDFATYKSVIDQLSGNIQYNSGNTNVYWNVFPVRRNTLEAYATTYCYFDRNNIAGWDATGDYTGNQYIDHYNALRDYGSYTEKKQSNESYKKRLNDPTLKYDEVW